MKISIITCTADSPAAFALCERWIGRAIDRLPKGDEVQWIVSDGGKEPALCTLGQTHLINGDPGDPKKNFLQNMRRGLEAAEGDVVVFAEHDDWYSPDWLRCMRFWLDAADVAGEARARYYNVASRRWLQCPNTEHASLCQTGLRRSMLRPLLQRIREHESTFIDVHFWKTVARKAKKLLWDSSIHTVGIKGLPGKNGIGIGHRLGEHDRGDSDGSKLREWIGEDATYYL